MIPEVMVRSFLHEMKLALERSGFKPPGEGEARVVLFDSAPWAGLCVDAQELLDAGERGRALRFRHAHNHNTYVLAHAGWRAALGMTLGMDAADVPLSSTANGQPQLPDTVYATSLSHSDSHVAMAIAKAKTVGVDIERYPPRHALHGLVDVLCAPAEAAALLALPAAAQTLALLQLWTRKEALLKAFGVGLREAPAAVVADLDRVVEPPASAAGVSACCVHQLELPSHLAGALAAPTSITRYSVHWLTPSDGGERAPTPSPDALFHP